MKSILLAVLLLPAVTFGDPPYGTLLIATGQKALTTTAVQVAPAGNSRQKSVLVRNFDDAISIYVGAAGVTSSTGMLLKAGESITLYTKAAIFAVAASGTPTAGYITEND